MNQGPRYARLMEKSRGQKSRATVPLSLFSLNILILDHFYQTYMFIPFYWMYVHLPILSDMFIFPLHILILYLSLTLLLYSYTSHSSALTLFPHTSLESILSYIYNSNKSPYFSLIYIFSKHII